MAGKITTWVLFLALTLLYAYMVVAALGNFLMLPELSATMGLRVTGIGWFWLCLGIALPIIAYGIALLVGRRKSRGVRLLVLATALAVTAMVQLEILHLVPQASFFAA